MADSTTLLDIIEQKLFKDTLAMPVNDKYEERVRVAYGNFITTRSQEHLNSRSAIDLATLEKAMYIDPADKNGETLLLKDRLSKLFPKALEEAQKIEKLKELAAQAGVSMKVVNASGKVDASSPETQVQITSTNATVINRPDGPLHENQKPHMAKWNAVASNPDALLKETTLTVPPGHRGNNLNAVVDFDRQVVSLSAMDGDGGSLIEVPLSKVQALDFTKGKTVNLTYIGEPSNEMKSPGLIVDSGVSQFNVKGFVGGPVPNVGGDYKNLVVPAFELSSAQETRSQQVIERGRAIAELAKQERTIKNQAEMETRLRYGPERQTAARKYLHMLGDIDRANNPGRAARFNQGVLSGYSSRDMLTMEVAGHGVLLGAGTTMMNRASGNNYYAGNNVGGACWGGNCGTGMQGARSGFVSTQPHPGYSQVNTQVSFLGSIGNAIGSLFSGIGNVLASIGTALFGAGVENSNESAIVRNTIPPAPAIVLAGGSQRGPAKS